MAGIFKDKIFMSAICIKKKTKIASFNSHLHKGNNLFCYETNIRSMITFICGGKNVKFANVFMLQLPLSCLGRASPLCSDTSTLIDRRFHQKFKLCL